jgi:peptidyl-Lys metalloendopeptidase
MRITRLVVVVLALSLALALSACAPDGAGPAATGDIVVGLHADATTFDRAAPLALQLTLANVGAASRHVLVYRTPLDGIDADILEVARDGEPVPYQGKLVKRGAPQADDFVEIAAGATLTVAFDPSEAYDMSLPGSYTVRYRAPALVAAMPQVTLRMRAEPVELEHLESDAVTVALKGRGETPEDKLAAAGGKPSGGSTCSTTQQSLLATAAANATVISGKALTYLQADPAADPLNLYGTWFDASGALQLWSTVETHYANINAAFVANQATFDCSCKKKTVYAYVYPTQPYKIYLCGYYWNAPALGTDSKAGTLVHEMSHFNVTASTQDWVYGTAGAMNLAQTDVTKSTSNADNHEYFAENQP